MTDADEGFGQRMARIRKERGTPGGRPRIADKHGVIVDRTERIFAKAMPDEAERYIEELQSRDPEECPTHHLVLQCPDRECGYESRRRPYDHRAAAYLFDRIMGKPTSRSENSLTVTFVQQITSVLLAAFVDVNGIDDAYARQAAFAERCSRIGAELTGTPA